MISKVKRFRSTSEVPPKEFYPDWEKLNDVDLLDDKYDYFTYNMPEMQKAIKLFFWCSATGNWEWFEFDKVFEICQKQFKERLLEEDLPLLTINAIDDGLFDHRKLGIDIDYSREKGTNEPIWDEVYEKFTKKGLSAEEWKAVEEFHCAKGAKDVWNRGIKFLAKYKRMHNPSLSEKITLFDNIIDIYHESGNYWGIDTPEIKRELEKNLTIYQWKLR